MHRRDFIKKSTVAFGGLLSFIGIATAQKGGNLLSDASAERPPELDKPVSDTTPLPGEDSGGRQAVVMMKTETVEGEFSKGGIVKNPSRGLLEPPFHCDYLPNFPKYRCPPDSCEAILPLSTAKNGKIGVVATSTYSPRYIPNKLKTRIKVEFAIHGKSYIEPGMIVGVNMSSGKVERVLINEVSTTGYPYDKENVITDHVGMVLLGNEDGYPPEIDMLAPSELEALTITHHPGYDKVYT